MKPRVFNWLLVVFCFCLSFAPRCTATSSNPAHQRPKHFTHPPRDPRDEADELYRRRKGRSKRRGIDGLSTNYVPPNPTRGLGVRLLTLSVICMLVVRHLNKYLCRLLCSTMGTTEDRMGKSHTFRHQTKTCGMRLSPQPQGIFQSKLIRPGHPLELDTS